MTTGTQVSGPEGDFPHPSDRKRLPSFSKTIFHKLNYCRRVFEENSKVQRLKGSINNKNLQRTFNSTLVGELTSINTVSVRMVHGP